MGRTAYVENLFCLQSTLHCTKPMSLLSTPMSRSDRPDADAKNASSKPLCHLPPG